MNICLRCGVDQDAEDSEPHVCKPKKKGASRRGPATLALQRVLDRLGGLAEDQKSNNKLIAPN